MVQSTGYVLREVPARDVEADLGQGRGSKEVLSQATCLLNQWHLSRMSRNQNCIFSMIITPKVIVITFIKNWPHFNYWYCTDLLLLQCLVPSDFQYLSVSSVICLTQVSTMEVYTQFLRNINKNLTQNTVELFTEKETVWKQREGFFLFVFFSWLQGLWKFAFLYFYFSELSKVSIVTVLF